jgi:uncharacterized protein
MEVVMEPRIHAITLAVDDIDRALAFYREGLGMESAGIIGDEFAGDDTNAAGAIAMFTLREGLMLCLYPRSELAKDANVALAAPSSGEMSLGHFVATRDGVDSVLRAAEAAGATLTGAPRDRPWGIYSGYFKDPDGHLWEVIWNPALEGT